MENEMKVCPYCGEAIMVQAKKCRYCGEWLEEAPKSLYGAGETEIQSGYMAEPVQLAESVGEVPATIQQQTPAVVPAAETPQVIVPGQQGVNVVEHPQQIVVNVQNNNTANAHAESNVTVVSGSSETSGWLWFQIVLMGGLVWGVAGAWWAGLVAVIVMIILLMIPGLGAVLCVLLGAGIGITAGALCAAFDAPTWVSWLVGIVATAGIIGINLEDRKKMMDDD